MKMIAAVLNRSVAKDAKDLVVIHPTREDMNTEAIAFVNMNLR